jgi:catechol 2,3-dioxygenase-like lactoylglutathione lyase family enzyme
MIFDHIGFNVSDFPLSKEFYLQALKPLGVGIVIEGEGWTMIGKEGKGQFWFGSFGNPPGGLHLAFVAENRQQVREFYTAALAAGGKDNGAPGLRQQYHPNYYAAFIIDPNGHNIEAVCHLAEASQFIEKQKKTYLRQNLSLKRRVKINDTKHDFLEFYS